MDIEEELKREHSRAQSKRIVDFVRKNPAQIDHLANLSLGPSGLISNRAVWSFGHLLDDDPTIASPYFERIISRITEPDCTETVKRNLCRILQIIDIPSKHLSTVFDLCYSIVENPEDAVAARAYCISVLRRICEIEPELKDEVILLIKSNTAYGSAAFKARARMELGRLKKLKVK